MNPKSTAPVSVEAQERQAACQIFIVLLARHGAAVRFVRRRCLVEMPRPQLRAGRSITASTRSVYACATPAPCSAIIAGCRSGRLGRSAQGARLAPAAGSPARRGRIPKTMPAASTTYGPPRSARGNDGDRRTPVLTPSTLRRKRAVCWRRPPAEPYRKSSTGTS